MQKQLDGEAPGAISILGVNAVGLESTNVEMTTGRVLPWLQDVAAVDAWGSWQATWRDVWIVDAAGDARGVYNLTEHDLNDPLSFATLKQLLLDAR
jgi:hypothetical protein